MVTLRILYTKENYMAFLGHLELMKLFERIFRFNKLPLSYSGGFNPIPKMTFASPLSVGYSSKCEIMEVQLDKEVSIESVLTMQFPDGIKAIEAKYVETKKSLMASLSHSEFLIKVEFKQPIDQLPIDEWIVNFLQAGEVTFEKKAKNGNMRTLNVLEFIESLKLVYKMDNDIILRAVLQTGSQGSLNPEKLVDVMCQYFQMTQEVETIRIERLMLFYNDEGHLKPLYDMKV
jgi:radical SAM-linked protein